MPSTYVLLKTRLLGNLRFLSLLGWAALALAPRADAQTPAALDVHLLAGLSVTGAVGTVYSVGYLEDLTQKDMHGNVAEWCLDWFGAYPVGIAVDPQGPASGISRVIRSGTWRTGARHCRSAGHHDGFWQGGVCLGIGFRVVLSPE
jgi:Sulfatase-modifying factor enzyme 1